MLAGLQDDAQFALHNKALAFIRRFILMSEMRADAVQYTFALFKRNLALGKERVPATRDSIRDRSPD